MNCRHFLPAAILLSAPAFAQGADDCTAAQPIVGSGPFAFDTSGATTDGLSDPLCPGNIEDDVWFSWTAADTGDHLMSLCGMATGDTKVSVLSGACGSSALACDDDACAPGGASELSFFANAGQSYLVRVGNFSLAGGSFGDFTIELDAPVLNPANGHYYRVVNVMLSWPEARMAAEQSIWQGQPGHLVTFADQAELDWVLLNIAPGRPWIGLYQNLMSPSYSEPSGGWEWITGEPVNLINWAPGEPNNNSATGGAEDYAEMFGSGVWNDAEEFHANTTQYLIEWSPGNVGTNYCAANTNSTGATGVMSAGGSPVISLNNLTLTAGDLPNTSFGFFLTSLGQGFVANPGGSQGNLCLGGAIGRYVGPGQIQNTGMTGEISLLIDVTQVPTPNGPVAAIPGETWNFQAWHRDAVAGSATSNFTDGLSVLFL